MKNQKFTDRVRAKENYFKNGSLEGLEDSPETLIEIIKDQQKEIYELKLNIFKYEFNII
jgi:hypothetical protein